MMPATPLTDDQLERPAGLPAHAMSAEDHNGKPTSPRPRFLQLPGLAAIALYLLMLAGVIVFGVVAGRHYPPLYLVLSAALITASAGLLLLLRWAWAMALGAVFLVAIYNLWIFSSTIKARRWSRACSTWSSFSTSFALKCGKAALSIAREPYWHRLFSLSNGLGLNGG